MAVLEKKYPAIPEPTQDVAALLKTVAALKQAVMILTGQANPNTKGIDEQYTDLRSTTGNVNARFTQYVEVSSAQNRALVQRTTTLESEVDQNTAKITEVERTTSDAISAVATRVTTLEANTEDGFASGSLKFEASASPGEFVAAYDLVLTANGAKSGFSVFAKNIGGTLTSGIVFTASQFTLFDPMRGVAPVFNYQDNLFKFNVPVQIRDIDLKVGAANVAFHNQSTGGAVIVGGIGTQNTPTPFPNEQCVIYVNVENPDYPVQVSLLGFVNMTANTLFGCQLFVDGQFLSNVFVSGQGGPVQSGNGLTNAPLCANALVRLSTGTHKFDVRYTYSATVAGSAVSFTSWTMDALAAKR